VSFLRLKRQFGLDCRPYVRALQADSVIAALLPAAELIGIARAARLARRPRRLQCPHLRRRLREVRDQRLCRARRAPRQGAPAHFDSLAREHVGTANGTVHVVRSPAHREETLLHQVSVAGLWSTISDGIRELLRRMRRPLRHKLRPLPGSRRALAESYIPTRGRAHRVVRTLRLSSAFRIFAQTRR